MIQGHYLEYSEITSTTTPYPLTSSIAVQSEILIMFAQGFCVDFNPGMSGLDPTPDVYVAMRRAMLCERFGWHPGQKSWLGRYSDGAQGI